MVSIYESFSIQRVCTKGPLTSSSSNQDADKSNVVTGICKIMLSLRDYTPQWVTRPRKKDTEICSMEESFYQFTDHIHELNIKARNSRSVLYTDSG